MTNSPSDDDAYLDHAIWILEWHERRSEAFVTRSVGLLGFNGVLLAFVMQLVTRRDFDPALFTYVALAAVLAALVGSAGFSLWTLRSQTVEAPGVSQLREWWSSELASKGPANTKRSVIERFLVGTKLTDRSPLDFAARSATNRAKRFHCATTLLFVGVVSLAALVLDVVTQT